MTTEPTDADTPMPDGDYVLTEGAAWVSAKGFSIRIIETDEGVVVDIYKRGEEMDSAIASTYAFDQELEDDFDENSD